MKDTLILVGLAVGAVVVGAGIYFMYGAALVSRTPNAAASAGTSATAGVAFSPLAAGTHSGVTSRVNYSITSPSELALLWKMTDAQGPVPSVDFATHSVIAVFAGTAPTGGYSVAISKIMDSEQSRTVVVTFVKPGGSCILPQVETAPYEIIAVPRTALPLTHTDTEQVTSCLQ